MVLKFQPKVACKQVMRTVVHSVHLFIADERQVGAEASIFSGPIDATSTYLPRIFLP